jgi:hypothetical protein
VFGRFKLAVFLWFFVLNKEEWKNEEKIMAKRIFSDNFVFFGGGFRSSSVAGRFR